MLLYFTINKLYTITPKYARDTKKADILILFQAPRLFLNYARKEKKAQLVCFFSTTYKQNSLYLDLGKQISTNAEHNK